MEIPLGDLKPGEERDIVLGPFPPGTTIRSAPITIRPCKPFWRHDGLWWALSGWAMPGNQCHTISPLNPFDVIAALWTFFRWRLPAVWRGER